VRAESPGAPSPPDAGEPAPERHPVRAALLRPSRLAGLVALGIVVALPLVEGPDARLRVTWFDLCQRLAPRVRQTEPAVIVAVDERSLARHGQWPWPRQLLAELVLRVLEGRPAAVGLDLLFPEADRFSSSTLAARLPGLDADTAAWLATLPDGDQALGRALAGAPTVVGLAGLDAPVPAPADGRSTPVVVRGGNALRLVRRYPAGLRSVAAIDEAAAGHGLLGAELSAGVLRRLPLVAALGERLVPGLGLEILRVAVQAPAFTVEVEAGRIASVAVHDITVPSEPDGTMWVHFTRHDPARFVSAATVLAGDVPRGRFERKLVLIGVTAPGLSNMHLTPLGERVPGVEIHAQALESIVEGRPLVRPHRAEWAEAGALLVAAALVLALTPVLRTAPGALVALGLVAVLLGGSFALYRQLALLLDGLSAALALALVYTATLGGTLAETDAQRRVLRRQLEEEQEAAARLAGELEAARRIQLGLLPRPASAFPDERRVRIAALMEPARIVGGDLFDFFLLDGDHLAFLVGDVSGKGLPASLFMATTKAYFRSLAARHGTRVADTVRQVSAEIGRDNPEAFFVTAVAGVLDLTSGRLWYCNAGHETPWALPPDAGAVARLEGGTGPPLCVLEEFAYETGERRLRPGETLLLVTDGVTEAANAEAELFGAARVSALVGEAAGTASGADPERLVGRLAEALRAFRGSVEPPDDVTVLALRWLGPDRREDAA
jgi:serine phosphatase RsbU (regulator of sigma subunit)/CHASE2 domain-containing sensor protein